MPPAEPDGLLDDALEANKHRLGPVIPRDHHFCVAGKHRQLLLTAVPATLQVRESAPIDGALHCLEHFRLKTQ